MFSKAYLYPFFNLTIVHLIHYFITGANLNFAKLTQEMLYMMLEASTRVCSLDIHKSHIVCFFFKEKKRYRLTSLFQMYTMDSCYAMWLDFHVNLNESSLQKEFVNFAGPQRDLTFKAVFQQLAFITHFHISVF